VTLKTLCLLHGALLFQFFVILTAKLCSQGQNLPYWVDSTKMAAVIQ